MDTCGHVGWQIKNTKETTNPNRKGRNAEPPARYALRHPAEKNIILYYYIILFFSKTPRLAVRI
jgi:hypothetical protein